MNLETLDLLTQKIEKALTTIRTLRTDNQRLHERTLSLDSQVRLLESQLGNAHAERERFESELELKTTEAQNLLQELSRKDQEIAKVRDDAEERGMELTLLQESLRDKEVKIQAAAERLEQVMNSLEIELDVRVPATEEEIIPGQTNPSEDKAFGSPQDLFGFSQR